MAYTAISFRLCPKLPFSPIGLPLPGLISKCFAKHHELNIRKYFKWFEGLDNRAERQGVKA